jgi:hypothetical protein
LRWHPGTQPFDVASPPIAAERFRRPFVIVVEWKEVKQEDVMGRGLLLWLLGIPIPTISLIWVLGGLHG